jgi:hypothetical protein
LPKEPSIFQDQSLSSKNTTINQKDNTAQAKKEKVHHKPDQEPKFVTMYVPKPTSHAHAQLDHATFVPNDYIIDFKINFIS